MNEEIVRRFVVVKLSNGSFRGTDCVPFYVNGYATEKRLEKWLLVNNLSTLQREVMESLRAPENRIVEKP